jgi:AcrR family transcriptional regulator
MTTSPRGGAGGRAGRAANVSPVPDPDADSDEGLRAADGRVPGRRGRATRQRLLDCTLEMLKTTSYRDLKVVDIARDAGTSPATFYQYFPDVESAVIVLAEDMLLDGRGLSDLVRDHSWKGKAGFETTAGLVDGFIEFWESHRPVMRVVELATEEGDQRFRKIRTSLLNELTKALAERVREFQSEGKHAADEDPMATAGVLVAMLAHVASHRFGFEFWGIRTDDLRQSMSRIIFWTVTSQKPPAG